MRHSYSQQETRPDPLHQLTQGNFRSLGSRVIDRTDLVDPRITVSTTYDFIRYKEGMIIPKKLASWLIYWSQTDPAIKTYTEGDVIRFANEDDISKKFTNDEGRRWAVAAIERRTGDLSGFLWLHPLLNDNSGHDIVNAVQEYNQYPQLPIIDIDRAATLAVRIYGEGETGYRNKGLLAPLVEVALRAYHEEHEDVPTAVFRAPARAYEALIMNPGIKKLDFINSVDVASGGSGVMYAGYRFEAPHIEPGEQDLIAA